MKRNLTKQEIFKVGLAIRKEQGYDAFLGQSEYDSSWFARDKVDNMMCYLRETLKDSKPNPMSNEGRKAYDEWQKYEADIQTLKEKVAKEYPCVLDDTRQHIEVGHWCVALYYNDIKRVMICTDYPRIDIKEMSVVVKNDNDMLLLNIVSDFIQHRPDMDTIDKWCHEYDQCAENISSAKGRFYEITLDDYIEKILG